MAGCPVCGGVKRSPLAPGYWRCESVVIDEGTILLPDVSNPAYGSLMPTSRLSERLCGSEYHDAITAGSGGMDYCACGTGAIGRCAHDHRPVCGYHSAIRGELRLCGDCVGVADAAAANERRLVQAESALRVLDDVRAICSSLGSIQDQLDRFIVLVVVKHLTPYMAIPRAGTEYRQIVEDAFAEMLISAAREHVEPRSCAMWNLTSEDPTGWVAHFPAIVARLHGANRLRGGTSLAVVTYRQRVLGGRKRVHGANVTAWQVSEGSRSSGGPYGSQGRSSEYVVEDGSVASVRFGGVEIQERTAVPDTVEHCAWRLAKLVETRHLDLEHVPERVRFFLGPMFPTGNPFETDPSRNRRRS